MEPTRHDALIEKLPHRGAMLLIDSILRVDKTSVETVTTIDAERAELFGFKGDVGSYLGVELIAQSAAFPLIFESSEGKEHAGMIVQVRSFESYVVLPQPNLVLRTQCEVELVLDGKVASVKGAVFQGERCLCAAVLTLAIGESK